MSTCHARTAVRLNRVLVFDPISTKKPGSTSLCKVLQLCYVAQMPFDPPKLSLKLVHKSFSRSYWLLGIQGEKKWLTVLIQTYSILRLHKSNQNFRYSALSGYVKQSLGIKAKVSTWKIAIITQNLKLNKIQIGFPQKKSCVEKKYKSYFFLIWDDSRPEDLANFSVDQESKSEVK